MTLNVNQNGSTISWEPPFSLNLSHINPNIIYCVDVYKFTQCINLTSDPLVSDCNVAHPHYTYTQQDGSDDLLQFIVTPRSNVDNAVNGISATRKGV